MNQPGQIHLGDIDASSALLRAVPRHPQLIDPQHPLRAQVEAFISSRFLAVHQARITQFMPQLFAVFNNRGEVLAALGIRSADSPLFLEYYLDQPIEQVLQQHDIAHNQSVSREQIVEIGNLASIDRSASARLFRFLASYLMRHGFQWASFTGCARLRAMFTHAGIETVALGTALQQKLPAHLRHWGRYYQDNPCILAGRVSHGQLLIEPVSTTEEAAA